MTAKLPRRKLRREAVLTRELRDVLETGHDILGYFGRSRLSDEELREKIRPFWQRFGVRVSRGYARRHPGQRPACWWLFEAPGPRPVAPPPNGRSVRNWEERDLLQRFLDRSFLIKHGLLTGAEQRAWDREAGAVMRMAEELKKNPPEPIPSPDPKSLVN